MLEATGKEMQESKGYKHIKVSASRNDEVVIKAGRHDGDDIDAQHEEVEDVDDSRIESSALPEEPKAEEASQRSHKEPAYQPTTLEDINAFKMSKVQIAVIVLAILAVIAFAVWYIAFS